MALGDYLYSMRGLMEITRYQNKHRIKPRTIAQHKWSSAKIAQMLALWHIEITGQMIDMGNLLEKSILEGTIKLFTGEIQSNTKHATISMLNAVNEAEEIVYESLYKEMLPDTWQKQFKDKVLYAKLSGVDGQILKASSIINTMLECIEEIELGNVRKFTSILKEELDELFKIDLEIVRWFIKYSLPELMEEELLNTMKIDTSAIRLEHGDCKEMILEFQQTFATYVYEIRGMMEIKRYQNLYRNKKRTVAEHEWFVSLIALSLAKVETDTYNNQVNLSSLLQTTISHDDIELFTGDILSYTKRTTDNLLKAIEEVERHIFETEYKPMIPAKWVSNFKKYILHPKDDTLEGRIMSTADIIDTIFEAIEEIKIGNVENFKPILKNSMEKLITIDLNSIDYFLLNSISEFGLDIKEYYGLEVYRHIRNLKNKH